MEPLKPYILFVISTMAIPKFSLILLLAALQVVSGQSAAAKHSRAANKGRGKVSTVPICTLIRRPELYHQKLIRIRAIEQSGYHGSFLYDVCDGKTQYLSLALDCSDESSCAKLQKALNINRRYSKQYAFASRVGLTVVGTFYGPKTSGTAAIPGALPESTVALTTSSRGYGHMGAFDFAFSISRVEATRAIPVGAPWSGSTEKDRIEQQLESTAFSWQLAQRDRRTSPLEKILADDFTLIDQSGRVKSKEQHLAEIKAKNPVLKIVWVEEDKYRLYGDLAVATGMLTLEGMDGRERYAYYTNIYLRGKGPRGWQLILTQVTPIKEEIGVGGRP